MKNIIDSFWPTYIGQFVNEDHGVLKLGLIKYIEDYIKKNPSRRGNENFQLFESNYDIHKSKNEDIVKLVKFFAQSFYAMAVEANKRFLKTKEQKLIIDIKDMWFIKYEKGGFVLPHTHGSCSWCCVYYLQIGKDSSIDNGSTYFINPNNYPRSNKDFGSKYFEGEIRKITANEGSMLVWPNYISHGSLPYNGEENRIIFSANASIYEEDKNGKKILSP
jgi:uncharacterized protein (TIGR02466 family)